MSFLAISTTEAVGDVVNFPDANLEAAVRDELGIPAPTPITEEDMEGLVYLEADPDGGSIVNLQGLQYATNLAELDLSWNSISDISALAGLTNLTHLSLYGNWIIDISAVATLTNLTQLGLSSNDIIDISAVATLTNLTQLDLAGNEIIDISAVATLTNLTQLDLAGNEISDISAVATLTNLTQLGLSYNQISDISAVATLTNLTQLYLAQNQISDISAVATLTNLTQLYLEINEIIDISAVATLTNLTQLYLADNEIIDISAVATLTNLTQLGLSWNQISDISAVTGLTNLTRLYLYSNQISDISAVATLTNLTQLYLAQNQISDISAVTGLTNLVYFDVGGNPLTNILLADTALSQIAFNVLMDGGASWCVGIAEVPGVLTFDMSGADFAGISDLSAMYTMDGLDDLEELSLAGATHLDGGEVVALTNQLASLNWLDVTGLWDSFDAGTQVALYSWSTLEGNTLVGSKPLIASWHLVAAHAGDDVVLVLNEGYIESRALPSLVLKLNFDVPLDPTTIVPGAVSLQGQVGGDLSGLISSLTLENGDTTLAVSLATGLPNADNYTFTLSETVRTLDGQGIGGQKSLIIGVLEGDVNKDGVVSNADILATRAWAAQPVDAASAQYDVNCSGTITGTDMLTIRRHLGNQLP